MTGECLRARHRHQWCGVGTSPVRVLLPRMASGWRSSNSSPRKCADHAIK